MHTEVVSIPIDVLPRDWQPVPALFRTNVQSLLYANLTDPMLWQRKHIPFEALVADEFGFVWSMERNAVGDLPLDNVICVVRFSASDGPIQRQISVHVGRRQPVFAVDDTRIFTHPLEYGFTSTFAAAYGSSRPKPNARMLAAQSDAIGVETRFHLSVTVRRGAEYGVDVFESGQGLRTFDFVDKRKSSRASTLTEIALYGFGKTMIGLPDESIIRLAEAGAGSEDWKGWNE